MTGIRLAFCAAALALAAAPPALASRHLSFDVQVKARQWTKVATPNGCDNRGSTIDLSGLLLSDSVNGGVWFQNNRRANPPHKTDEFPVDAAFTVLVDGRTEFYKQPSLGGVGGNPWIALDFPAPLDDNDPLVVGRCVQGLYAEAFNEFLIPARIELDVSSGDCENSGGPTITLDGSIAIGGIELDLFLQNKRTEPVHWDRTDAELGIQVTTPSGQDISIAKSPHWGGAGGNPYVFLDVAGAIVNLGRCNKI